MIVCCFECAGVNVLATQLVDQWLKIVKDETVPAEVTSTVLIVKQEDIVAEEEVATTAELTRTSTDEPSQIVISPQSFYKLTVRDGKQVIAKVDSVVNNSVSVEQSEDSVIDNMTVVSEETCATAPSEQTENEEHLETTDKEVKKITRDKDRSRHSSKHKSSSSRNSSSSSNKDKHTSSSRDKYKDKNSSNRDRMKEKEHRDKSKHRSNGSTKHSSSSSSSSSNNSKSDDKKDIKENKEKQAEKDKDTLAKIQPKTMEKMGRIPKKSTDDKEKAKSEKDKKSEPRNKPSISIEVRKKDSGEKPRKTVKVFHSKLRSTGLEEAAKPPPPRASAPVKKPQTTLPSIPLKRVSPSREVPPPPEKRLKLPDAEVEKPGGIKLIPAKPKRKYFTADSNLDFRFFFRASLVAFGVLRNWCERRVRRFDNQEQQVVWWDPSDIFYYNLIYFISKLVNIHIIL